MQSQLFNYLKIIRFPNLVFLAFTQLVIQRVVINPILQVYGFDSYSPSVNLLLLVLATLFVTAGGYVLNDYFDIKIDAINSPDKQIVGRYITKKNAMRYYQVITAVGILLGLTLSFILSSFTLAFIFIMVPGLLWFYSSNYKRQFIVGNLVVSFSIALSILIVAIAEVTSLSNYYGILLFETLIPKTIYSWVSGFAIFAFFLTWIREIVKDIEDEEGDRELECRTMPIKWGIHKTKTFIYALIGVVIVALLWVNISLIPFEGNLTFRYTLFGLIIPLIVLIFMVYRAKQRTEYHQVSTLVKFIMLIGVLYAFIFYYLQAKTYGISIFGLFVV